MRKSYMGIDVKIFNSNPYQCTMVGYRKHGISWFLVMLYKHMELYADKPTLRNFMSRPLSDMPLYINHKAYSYMNDRSVVSWERVLSWYRITIGR